MRLFIVVLVTICAVMAMVAGSWLCLPMFAIAAFLHADSAGDTIPDAYQAAKDIAEVPKLANGDFQEVVGESNYQLALNHIAGGRTKNGPRQRTGVAYLVAEPDNEHDPKAVMVQVKGFTVGYIPKSETKAYRYLLSKHGRLRCDYSITGGWDKGWLNKGSFGIELDIGQPPAIEPVETVEQTASEKASQG